LAISIGIDTGTTNEADGTDVCQSVGNDPLPVIAVLNDQTGILSAQGKFEGGLYDPAQDRRKHVAKTAERIDNTSGSHHPRDERPVDYGLESNVMDNVRGLSTINPDKLHKRAKLFQGIESAAVERYRSKRETRIRDAFAMLIDTSRHYHVIPGMTGGDGEFEPM
jgi:hypothetical protein